MSFSKENVGPIDVCCVSTTEWKKKVKINIAKFVCREEAMRADVSLDATIVNLTSKSLNIHSYADMKYKPILSLKQETHSSLWKYVTGPSVKI